MYSCERTPSSARAGERAWDLERVGRELGVNSQLIGYHVQIRETVRLTSGALRGRKGGVIEGCEGRTEWTLVQSCAVWSDQYGIGDELLAAIFYMTNFTRSTITRLILHSDSLL